MLRVLKYLETRYEGYLGVPVELLDEELLEVVKPPKEAIIKTGLKSFISVEWVAKTVEELNSK